MCYAETAADIWGIKLSVMCYAENDTDIWVSETFSCVKGLKCCRYLRYQKFM